nr:hypothetical protein [Tanacetum cinerariifolium]
TSHSPSSSTSSITPLPPPHANLSSPAEDLIENLTSTLALLTQSYRTFLPQTNNQLRTSSSARNQATVQDGRVVVQNVQGDPIEAQENRVALDAEQLLFLAGRPNNAFDDDVDEQPVQDLALNMDNLDEQWFVLTKDTLREAFQITPINNNQLFVTPPSYDTLINFVNELGYPKLVKNVSNVVTNDMFQPRRALLTIINLCLTGKTSRFKRPKAPVLQILWGIVKQANIDYAERIWKEFRRHKFHPRPDSSLHLPNEDHVLGYLKFSAKGTKREVFGIPIPAGSESRPPMLNKENYVPWSSRLLRYAKSRPNGKLIHNSILNGPYVRKMIPEPGDANREITVTDTFHLQTDDELSDKELKQIEADDQAIQT